MKTNKHSFFGLVVFSLTLVGVTHAQNFRAMVIPVDMLPPYPITNISELPQPPNAGVLSHRRFGFTTEPSNLKPGVASDKLVTLVVVDDSTGGFIPNVNASFTRSLVQSLTLRAVDMSMTIRLDR